ncbi:DUF3160 domain-containing protein [Luteolibacter ambystomatis]|uniref:DUF3160 domain-containing protein n=1 Tax=Luteolibacter ambystomatis TaxID=2824561 RepID=A0A975IY67_9BACT|nr:DUF3160 domain-containing protein [Luteolibacter ambystomatis]QUE49814.1 DUF3160 domain-containing protein [Luteolibacter ambystomatis]
MKTRQMLLGAWLCGATAFSQVALPEAAPGPFAPVPAKLSTGPELPTQPMEPKPPALKDCANATAVYKTLGIKLSDEQKKTLEKDRFILIPLESTWLAEDLPTTDEEKEWAFTQDEMLSAFSQTGGTDPEDRKPWQTRLITPDVVLHAWHAGFSRVLEYIEQRRLHEVLTIFLEGSLDNVRELRSKATGPAADRLGWTEARFAAPWILLGPPAPPDPDPSKDFDEEGKPKPTPPRPSYDEVVKQRLARIKAELPAEAGAALEKEISLVMAAEGMSSSPLFGKYAPDKPSDYTQYKVRSHYTKSDTLGGYFRAMMFLGRNGYELKSAEAIGDAQLATLAMARTTSKGATPLTAWKEVMEITGFFAGQSDDITYTEFREWIGSTLGKPALETEAALSTDTATKLTAALGKLRAPIIVSTGHADQTTSPDSDPKAFRVFGQRFTWDARVLDRLTRGAPQDMPALPTAAMIPAAFGDEKAEAISKDYLKAIPDKGAAYAAEFDKRLPDIRKELAGVSDNDWFASMASKQLHVISMLAKKRNANFPAYMQSPGFAAKNVISMLGSYTELKHDTVLYAKQSYAEMGDGAEEGKIPPAPHGLVQPDVAFWREMERLATFANDGFTRHKLLPDAEEEFNRFRMFAKSIKRFREIAEKDVAGQPITDKDWEAIRTADFSQMARPILPYDEPKPGEGKNALVTDIHTDAAGGKALHQGLGRPQVMIAIGGGRHGNRLLVGLAYNYYEFARSLEKGRMTDEEWQSHIYVAKPELPARSVWQPPVTKPATVKREE